MRSRLGAAFFDDLYARDADPWDFETSRYEAEKYVQTIAALDGRRFTTALEVGCSIGVLTERLAEHCDNLLAIDVVESALVRAHERVPQVRFERREIPEQYPPGTFELTVCSEVLYYLDSPALNATLDRITGTLLAVHWRHPTERYPFTGDEVHEQLAQRFGAPAYRRWTKDYALDRFDRCGS